MTFLSFSKASHSKVSENSGYWYCNGLAVQLANFMNTTHISRSCSMGGKGRVRDTSYYRCTLLKGQISASVLIGIF